MTESERYAHTQVAGWQRIAAALVAITILVLAYYASRLAEQRGAAIATVLVGGGIPVALLYLFSSLTVVIRDDTVAWWFGPGVPRYTLPLRDVRDARVVRKSWLWGWGIRWIPGGWLYRVNGLSAVEIDMGDRRVLLGTDEPEGLRDAILAARAPATPGGAAG